MVLGLIQHDEPSELYAAYASRRHTTSSPFPDFQYLRIVMAKTCFVIGPIGEPGSPVRENADNFMKYISSCHALH
jgi:hypothetical protein